MSAHDYVTSLITGNNAVVVTSAQELSNVKKN